MDIKRLFICIFIAFCPITQGFTCWNEECDKQSHQLGEFLPEMRRKEYRRQYEEMQEDRRKLLKDGSLRRIVKALPVDQKAVFPRPREGLIVKKRQFDRIHELYAWEVSFLLDEAPCVVQAMPFFLEGKKVILQKMEPFVFGRGKEELPSLSDIKKVSLEEYWLAHLKAYILGLGDLVGRNIGINPIGKIRFFDAEYCFHYKNYAHKQGKTIGIGFVSESLEWPQYRKPLDYKTAQTLQRFVASLACLEEKLHVYEQIRAVSLFNSKVDERLDRVRSFFYEEGVSFQDFFLSLYPDLAPGLDADKI